MQLKFKDLFERMSFHMQALNIKYMTRNPPNLQKHLGMMDHKLQQSPSLHSCVRKCRNCDKTGYSYFKTNKIPYQQVKQGKKNRECAQCDDQHLAPHHQEAIRYETCKICDKLSDIMPYTQYPQLLDLLL